MKHRFSLGRAHSRGIASDDGLRQSTAHLVRRGATTACLRWSPYKAPRADRSGSWAAPKSPTSKKQRKTTRHLSEPTLVGILSSSDDTYVNSTTSAASSEFWHSDTSETSLDSTNNDSEQQDASSDSPESNGEANDGYAGDVSEDGDDNSVENTSQKFFVYADPTGSPVRDLVPEQDVAASSEASNYSPGHFTPLNDSDQENAAPRLCFFNSTAAVPIIPLPARSDSAPSARAVASSPALNTTPYNQPVLGMRPTGRRVFNQLDSGADTDGDNELMPYHSFKFGSHDDVASAPIAPIMQYRYEEVADLQVIYNVGLAEVARSIQNLGGTTSLRNHDPYRGAQEKRIEGVQRQTGPSDFYPSMPTTCTAAYAGLGVQHFAVPVGGPCPQGNALDQGFEDDGEIMSPHPGIFRHRAGLIRAYIEEDESALYPPTHPTFIPKYHVGNKARGFSSTENVSKKQESGTRNDPIVIDDDDDENNGDENGPTLNLSTTTKPQSKKIGIKIRRSLRRISIRLRHRSTRRSLRSTSPRETAPESMVGDETAHAPTHQRVLMLLSECHLVVLVRLGRVRKTGCSRKNLVTPMSMSLSSRMRDESTHTVTRTGERPKSRMRSCLSSELEG